MTEPYKSLENRIREMARQTMQKKLDEGRAKMRLTTKIMEEPKPEPEMIEEGVEDDEAKIKGMGWTKNKLDKWVHPHHPDYGNGRAKNVLEDLPDLEKLRAKKAEIKARGTIKKEEVEIDELSNDTLNSYKKKAKIDRDHGTKKMVQGYGSGVDTRHKRSAGISAANVKLGKAWVPPHLPFHTIPLKKEEVEIEELASTGAPNPMKAKMDAQRQQVQKQKEQIRMQLAQQKAAKQEQAMKQKGEKSLEKIKETEELDERQVMRVRTFGRASKLQQLHNKQYSRFAASGDMAKAELHRKRAIEYKRIQYQAKDNPGKLPVV